MDIHTLTNSDSGNMALNGIIVRDIDNIEEIEDDGIDLNKYYLIKIDKPYKFEDITDTLFGMLAGGMLGAALLADENKYHTDRGCDSYDDYNNSSDSGYDYDSYDSSDSSSDSSSSCD